MSRELRELAQDDLDALLDLQRYLHESDDPPPTRAVLERAWARGTVPSGRSGEARAARRRAPVTAAGGRSRAPGH